LEGVIVGAGIVGLVVVVLAIATIIALVEFGLFEWTADSRPIDPGARRGTDRGSGGA
jgi:hypothetical protein